jgi:hypothetical protein
VFENRVLRRIFGPKRDEVTGEWRKLHSEELHNLYLSPGIILVSKVGLLAKPLTLLCPVPHMKEDAQ